MLIKYILCLLIISLYLQKVTYGIKVQNLSQISPENEDQRLNLNIQDVNKFDNTFLNTNIEQYLLKHHNLKSDEAVTIKSKNLEPKIENSQKFIIKKLYTVLNELQIPSRFTRYKDSINGIKNIQQKDLIRID